MNSPEERKALIRSACRIFLAATLIAAGSMTAMAAELITGRARNQTRSQPAAGDKVLLLRLDHRHQEAHTRTDSRGVFSLGVHDSDKSYLLRVVHQGVNYDQQVAPGTAVSVDVFDSAAKVEGLTGSIEIIRIATIGTQLHVSDMIGIENRSRPPTTQAGTRTYDVYLPDNARIDSVLAAGPGDVGVVISATPVAGDPGHYSLNFPFLPGTTKLAFNYDLPYDGHAVFRIRHAYPLQQLAVMIPPSMKFSSRSTAFKILQTGNKNYQVLAMGQLQAGPGPEFEISGTATALPSRIPKTAMALPAVPVAPAPTVAPASASMMSPPHSPGATPSASENSRARRLLSYLQFWPLALPVLVVAAAGTLAIRRARQARRAHAPQTAAPASEPARPSLDGLKEELFQLEAAKIRGSISLEQYRSTRSALEQSVRRAVGRAC